MIGSLSAITAATIGVCATCLTWIGSSPSSWMRPSTFLRYVMMTIFFLIKHDLYFFASMYNFPFLQLEQCIPFHARRVVLEKLGFEDSENMETRIAHLRTQHGYAFWVKLYNAVNHSHFGCLNWRALCKAQGFHEDMKITFDIRPEDDIEDNIDIWVDLDMPRVLPLREFIKQIC